MSAYDLWKTAHILAAAIIFGVGLGIAFYCWFSYRGALRTRDIGPLRSALRVTMVADAWLTAPALAFLAASGLRLMDHLGWGLASPLSSAVGLLFLLVCAFWVAVLFIRGHLARMAGDVPAIEWLPASFHVWFASWVALGFPALAAVVAIYWLMVAKPLAVI